MKMLKAFTEQLDQLSEIEKVWFTTFSLDIGFFEKYLLSAVMGIDPPKSMSDYEILEQKHIDSCIDVRIFCDKSMFMQADLDKNTSVPIYPVSLSSDQLQRYNKGLYHPKVIMIKGTNQAGSYEDPMCILGAGSANLTLSGWGRNIEVFIWQQIQDRRNLNRMNKFFKQTYHAAGLKTFEPIDAAVQDKQNEFLFLHSFEDTENQSDFIKHLREDDPSRLDVFSPFFSSDLMKVLEKLRVTKFAARIIPDTSNGLRMTEEQYIQFKANLFTYPHAIDHDEMVHAKVWITDTNMAIGSWNMTLPGIGAAEDRNNIEAGFLFSESGVNIKLDHLQEQVKLSDAFDEEISTHDKMKPWLSIQVQFDWEKYKYHIDWSGGTTTDDCFIKLPGVQDKFALDSQEFFVRIQRRGEIIKHKFFHIYDTKDENSIRQSGCIIEINKDKRQGWRFQTMGDIFSHYLNMASIPSPNSTDQILTEKRYEDPEYFQIEDNHGESYFLIFRALYLFEQQLDEKRSKDKTEYQNLLYNHPGSLLDLSKRVEMIIKDEQTKLSFVHRFMLVKELDRLIALQDEPGVFLKEPKEAFGTWLDKHKDQTQDLNKLYGTVIEENWHAKTHQ